jgi:phosphoribosylaminoimidazole carboxylase
MAVPAAIMLNILGGVEPNSHKILVEEAIFMPNAALHMYGKASKPGRKIGHITVTGASMAEAEKSISKLIILADNIRAERKFAEHTIGASLSKPTVVKASPKQHTEQPLVAITMGSDSDLPVLKPGIALLKDLGIPYLVTITSAHRTPTRMTRFAQEAAGNGIKVIIAAAGGAAHLPGMVAASTSLPVIGVPVKGSTLDGMDSLLSIVQMPRGVPVATVAINNSINAALLAARILGASDLDVREKLDTYARQMEGDVLGKVDKLDSVGWERYGEKP